ncbi:MAG: hypothetical protein LC797_11025 [Chloroflexi bacterium]|nr:hypothetical protein [Chloroflexota bacterium]
MGTVLLGARLVLVAVFTTAAVGKLLDLPGSRRALVDFGVSESIAGVGGTALPLVELATAVGLLVRPSARVAAAVALVLLVGFVAGIGRALARGEAPDCHCFGTIHSAPAGRGQIGRNVVLAALAGFVLGAGPGPTVDGWVSARGASEFTAVFVGIVALALLAASLQTWRENRRLREELTDVQKIAAAMPPGLPVGALAPGFAVRDPDGEALTLDALRARGRPIALMFVSPGCGPCSSLVPEAEAAGWRDAFGDSLTLALVGAGTMARYVLAETRIGGTPSEIRDAEPELAREIDELHELFGTYRLFATPSAVIVTPEGTIASATVNGRPAIEALIRLTLARRGAPGIAISSHAVAAA